jgi:hypothetical protein
MAIALNQIVNTPRSSAYVSLTPEGYRYEMIDLPKNTASPLVGAITPRLFATEITS